MANLPQNRTLLSLVFFKGREKTDLNEPHYDTLGR